MEKIALRQSIPSVSGDAGCSLSRARIWAQFVLLGILRAINWRAFAPVHLRYPRVDLYATKNPWLLYREIFVRDCYALPLSGGPRPRILDLGANIGLASLYFLTRWPQARLTAFEPNPRAFALLKRNLAQANFTTAQIELEPVALSTADGTIEFQVPFGNPTAVYAGILKRGDERHAIERVFVPTRDARHLFSEPADLIKLDIEGHEYPVLNHVLPSADTVRSLIIEFHEIREHGAECSELLARLLGEQGYVGQDERGQPLVPSEFIKRPGAGLLRFARRR